MLLSIVVPIYNVESYLPRCLNSLFNQDLKESEFEVIVVNDGSKDSSLNIAENFADTHHNIKIISQKNRGLSAARNTGIENATGNYVWFVDSDDFIEQNSIKPLLKYTIENNLDVLCFNLQLYFESGKIEKFNNPMKFENRITDGQSFLTSQPMPPAAVLALYKRKLLEKNNLRFKEGILHEDQEFTPRAYFLANRITYIDKVVYNYYQREGSIMKSSMNDKRVISFLAISDSLYEFTQKNVSADSIAYSYFCRQIAFVFSQAVYYWNPKSSISLREIKNKPYYPLTITDKMSKKERLKILLMNKSIRLYKLINKLVTSENK